MEATEAATHCLWSPGFSAGFWRSCAGKRMTAKLSGSFLPAKCPCQSIFPWHARAFPAASFPYPRSWKKSITAESWQQRMAGEVLQTDLNPPYEVKCLQRAVSVSSCKGIQPSAEVPGTAVPFTFPHPVYPWDFNPCQGSFGMSDLAIQHSMSPRFSICSFPAPLQQQEVSPFPSPAMCCRVPKRAQISSPNPAMGTFLLPPPPWSVQMCPPHPSCSLLFGLRARANPPALTTPQTSSWGGPHRPPRAGPGDTRVFLSGAGAVRILVSTGFTVSSQHKLHKLMEPWP